MKRHSVQKVLLAFFFLLSTYSFSQSDTIYFSSTGDTVLYSRVSYQKFDSLNNAFNIHIIRKHPIDTIQQISQYTIKTKPSINSLVGINSDTLKKYNLEYDGTKIYPFSNEDFIISIKSEKIKLIGTCELDKPNNVYKTKVWINILCTGQSIYRKKINYTFKGNSVNDFNSKDILSIIAWKKKAKRKYLILISVIEKQIINVKKDEGISIRNEYLFFN